MYFSKNVCKILKPVEPLLSGWNCVANTLPCYTALIDTHTTPLFPPSLPPSPLPNYFSKNVCKILKPVEPLFSGWNCVAKTLPCCTAEIKLVPYVVRVSAQGAASGEGIAR